MCIRDSPRGRQPPTYLPLVTPFFGEDLCGSQREEKFVIYSDGSDYAVGSVVYQKDSEGKLRVIAYASRVFKGAERHYSTSEKEILAIVYALKQFRYYIYGTHFEIRTDHQALSFLLKCKVTNSRLLRWILAIGEYSFTCLLYTSRCV